MKSPTTTPLDIQAVEELAEQLNIDVAQFSLEMFKAGTSLEGQSIEEIFYKDFKEFKIKDHKIELGKSTLILRIFNRKVEFLNIPGSTGKGQLLLDLLLITYFAKRILSFYKSKDPRLTVFLICKKSRKGTFISGYIVRKKQVIPK